jgi:hypothetical protein
MAHKMISNQKVVKDEVSKILGIYNFHFGSFSVRGHLEPVGHQPAYLPDMAHKTMKMLSTANIHKFSRSRTFILVVSPSEVI